MCGKQKRKLINCVESTGFRIVKKDYFRVNGFEKVGVAVSLQNTTRLVKKNKIRLQIQKYSNINIEKR